MGSIEFIIGWRLVWARLGIWAGANDKENWLGENEKFRECPRQVRAFHSKALIFSSQYTAKRFQISTPVSRKKSPTEIEIFLSGKIYKRIINTWTVVEHSSAGHLTCHGADKRETKTFSRSSPPPSNFFNHAPWNAFQEKGRK